MSPESALSELKRVLLQFKSEWRWVFFLSVLIGLLGFTSTVYMLQVYERVVNSRDMTTLVMLTLVTLAAYLVMEVLEKIRARLLWGVGVRFDLALARRLHHAMFEMMAKRPSAGLFSVQSDMRVVREFFGNPAIGAVFELPVALISLVLIFAINPLLGWAAVLGAFLQTSVAWLIQRVSRKPLKEAQRRSQEAQSYAETSLRNAQVMESMGMLPAVMGRWKAKQQSFLAFQAEASEGAGALNAVSKLLQQLMGSVLLGLSAWLLLHNELRGGGAMVIISSVLGGRLLAPITLLVQQWSAFLTVSSAWNRLETLLEHVPVRPTQMALPSPKGQLTVEGLVASPPGQVQPVLRGLQFALSPGQVLAVIGPSASGKTSLARVMVGVWAAQAGKVRLDGVDVHAWDKAELGPYIGYLPQGVELLEGSIAENIARFGDLDYPKIEQAARLVGLHDLIATLPEGYDTPIGRDGAVLSGGQRQRVALARAIYGSPVLVVLDEPNSSLDEAGDQALAETIQTLKARGTTFVINTHRTSVLAVADRLLLIQEGAQQLFGPVKEVLERLQGKATAPAVAVTQVGV